MTLKHMKVFLEVYTRNSITQAAQALHMVQPAVSRAVMELEDYYGCRFFDRIGKRLFVTESGRQFYDHALQIIESVEDMEQLLKNGDSRGVLRVGSTVTIGTCFMPKLSLLFKEKAPNVRLKVNIENSETLQNKIMKNELDLALVEGPVLHRDCTAKIFYSDCLTAISAPSHPLASREKVCLKELADANPILREKGSAAREVIESKMLLRQISLEPSWESISTEAIICAVETGIGVSILPHLLVQDEIEAGRLVRLSLADADFSRNYSIITHKNKFQTTSARLFTNLCLSVTG